MRAKLLVTAALLLTSCTSSGDEPQQSVEIDRLRFSVPVDWERADMRSHDGVTAVWSPTDNPRKQSIAVVRSSRPATANADAGTLKRLLAGAQQALPHVRSSEITAVRTAGGMAGVRVSVDFVPAGQTRTYHRVHAVLVNGTDIVNVLYTSADPDASLGAFNLVLASIRHEEG